MKLIQFVQDARCELKVLFFMRVSILPHMLIEPI
jgi:hypothetical protein